MKKLLTEFFFKKLKCNVAKLRNIWVQFLKITFSSSFFEVERIQLETQRDRIFWKTRVICAFFFANQNKICWGIQSHDMAIINDHDWSMITWSMLKLIFFRLRLQFKWILWMNRNIYYMYLIGIRVTLLPNYLN